MNNQNTESDSYYYLNNFEHKKLQKRHIFELLCIFILFVTTAFCLLQINFIRQEIENLKFDASQLHISTARTQSNEFSLVDEEKNNKNKRDVDIYSTKKIRDHVIVFNPSTEGQASQDNFDKIPSHVISNVNVGEPETTNIMQTEIVKKKKQSHVILASTTESSNQAEIEPVITADTEFQAHIILSPTTETNQPSHVFTSSSCNCPAGR